MGQTTTSNSITDSASQVFTSDSDTVTLTFTNEGSDNVYIGSDNSITDSNAFPIFAGEELKCNDYIGDWYAICASGETSTLRIDKETV